MTANVFILNPLYQGYPDSGTPHQHTLKFETVANVSNESQWQALVPFLIVCCGLFLCLLTTPLPAFTLPAVGSPGFIILLILLAVSALRYGTKGFRQLGKLRRQNRVRYQRLLNGSQVLSGEVVGMVCRLVPIGRGQAFETVAHYQFVNPQGEIRTGMQYTSRRRQPIPPGTPIRVLYADDDASVLL
ncbi:MAG: hypothetical protein J0M07_27650 [Anaerolineae bacterium]|nr:hypothetical protein [Anaerolineae bacterium]